MLPFPLLLLLFPPPTPAQSTSAKTSTLTSLLPPYPGSATYQASIAAILPEGTVFAISCAPPASTITSLPDPCLRSQFGTNELSFTQGSSTWEFRHTALSTNENGDVVFNRTYYTGCDGSGVDEFECLGYNFLDEVVTSVAGDAGELGLRQRDVVVTAGWDKVDNPAGVEATSTSSEGGFTDIGRSATKEGPVATVTVHKTTGNAAVRGSGGVGGWTVVGLGVVVVGLVV
ncbi:hypothetical protein EJ04DRAFT_512869 [Polyplosphaeria fusca]|uniref:Uncharacterized protein n=1 Tax=Polyplosphaeria fusca TaxID=682080 RepID=A0A9P4QW85_9PLEO|nr:hypothetical protein EJ04DRAFT_512869 [Polyplosphaeria fusca]